MAIISPSYAPAKVRTDWSIRAGLAAVVIFFVLTTYAAYWNTTIINRNAEFVTRTHEIILSLDNLFSLVKDAETGQRGFVITGDKTYLDPYNKAVVNIPAQIAELKQMLKENTAQLARLTAAEPHIAAKLSELNETVLLRRDKGFEAAHAVVITDRGKNDMDAIRFEIGTMQQDERETRVRRLDEMKDAYRLALFSNLVTGILGVLLSCAVAALVHRATATRQRQQWMQMGQVGLSSSISGEYRIDELGLHVLTFLSRYMGAQAGAFYSLQDGLYSRAATYGLPETDAAPVRFKLGEGLLGQAALDRKPITLNDVPDGYLKIGSSLGRGNPRHLVIFPVTLDNIVNAVFELGFLQLPDALVPELLERVSETIAVAVRSSNYRVNLHNLLEETQRQAEELQSQSEELRVSNEELEEQSRALKASQVSLEQQQAELEQSNAQLEEQTQLLEDERDSLSRTKSSLQVKTQELEQSSQYKSDFLANMSHELRTPLNSSLILAKLLSDNPEGNLSAEQVKYAQTIQSSGNDLLMLINDILDLSKIEAGHMEVRPENMPISRLAKDIKHVFGPMAMQKGLELEINILPGCPATIETDRQRLEQVLKNLLSNAIKFTEKGKVALNVSRTADGQMIFSVTDTGIGITPEKQDLIFEAFRQADSTISRKYGGTGLGLSISRELARLLGGSINVVSSPGSGSTFSITLPQAYDAARVQTRQQSILSRPESAFVAPPLPTPESGAAPVVKLPQAMEDDRERLNAKGRIILVIEDDVAFARILYDLAHELGFQCIVTTTAEEGVIAARQYMPGAILLDMNLPDDSGLTVIDRLKRDTRTRHIPIHVVSGSDYAQTAMSLGAVGYMVKPVKREELVDVLKRLENRLAQRMRRVLIVEDDPVQRSSVSKLLTSHEVSTVEAGTVAECLDLLKEQTFDCLVLDLSLPDASGYSLLETLSKEDSYSFPPVIVYTGRELSGDEEQRLRRYSKSIIIKGAKSPERLLDEVTLFLHQVVAELPPEQQRMLEKVRNRDDIMEGRRILVVEDDVRNVYALTSIFEPRGAIVRIARNGREGIDALIQAGKDPATAIDLVLMDVMMPEMDGLTATREIRKNAEWKKLPIIMLTAKAMKEDQDRCIAVGANDYMAKPLDVEKLLSLVRIWMPR